MDFVALGYGPEQFEPFLAAGADAEFPKDLIQKARGSSKFHDQENLNEICYRWNKSYLSTKVLFYQPVLWTESLTISIFDPSLIKYTLRFD